MNQSLGLDAGNGKAEVVGKPVLRVSIEFDIRKCLLKPLVYQVRSLSQPLVFFTQLLACQGQRFRHPDNAELDRLDAQFPREAGFLARDCGVRLELTPLFKVPAQPFDPACVELVRQAASRLGFSAREIVSGAGHDAVYVARHIPTAMIFTPCKDGLSHNEAESIEPEEAEAGCQVLFEAVLARANRVLA